MNHNELTTSQRRRIISAIRFYRNRNRYNGCTSVRVKIDNTHGFSSTLPRFVSMSLETRRSDCEQYSPRQVMTKQFMFAIIGRRGGMKIASASDSLRSNLSFVRTMLHAS